MATFLRVRNGGRRHKAYLLAQPATSVGGNLYWLEIPGSQANSNISAADVYRPNSTTFHGTVDPATPDQLTVDAADTTNTSNGPIAVTVNGQLSFHTITSLAGGVLTVKPRIRGAVLPGPNADYQYLTAVNITQKAFCRSSTRPLLPISMR